MCLSVRVLCVDFSRCACPHGCASVYVSVIVCVSMHAHLGVCLGVRVHVRLFVCVCVFVCMHACVCARVLSITSEQLHSSTLTHVAPQT